MDKVLVLLLAIVVTLLLIKFVFTIFCFTRILLTAIAIVKALMGENLMQE